MGRVLSTPGRATGVETENLGPTTGPFHLAVVAFMCSPEVAEDRRSAHGRGTLEWGALCRKVGCSRYRGTSRSGHTACLSKQKYEESRKPQGPRLAHFLPHPEKAEGPSSVFSASSGDRSEGGRQAAQFSVWMSCSLQDIPPATHGVLSSSWIKGGFGGDTGER